MFHHINKMDNIFTMTPVEEHRKIPALGLWSFLGLRLGEHPQHHAGIFLYSPPLFNVQTQYSKELTLSQLFFLFIFSVREAKKNLKNKHWICDNDHNLDDLPFFNLFNRFFYQAVFWPFGKSGTSLNKSCKMFEYNFRKLSEWWTYLLSTKKMWEARSTCSNKVKFVWHLEFGVNTKLVLGFPRAKQVGLEHCKKNLRGCDHRHTIYISKVYL